MILIRPGNKRKIAKNIISYFPKHNVYLEPFFGAGGVFFSKQKSMHNFLNDIDNDVFNLWDCFVNNNKELLELLKQTPKHESIFKYYLRNTKNEKLSKALRFLFLSQYSIYGIASTFGLGASNPKKVLLDSYNLISDFFGDTNFTDLDFREFYRNIRWTSFYEINNFLVFSYNDPPYLGTSDNYSHSFTEQDSFDLFEINCQKAKEYPNKYFFAISEFNHPFILEQAKQRNLNLIEIGERRNIKNRKTEILITNYETQKEWF